MTSLPQLNPNAAGQGTPEARFNRATLGVYELGSTFKPFTVAMAMDAGVDQIDGADVQLPAARCTSSGRTINDTHPFGRACSVAEIMKESSNIGTAQIADQLGATRQKEFLRKMGFLDQVEIELKERGRTLTPGSQLGPDRDDDRRLRPWHRGHPAPPRDRLCDAVQWRHLSARRPCSRSAKTMRPARATASSPRKPATRCARCCAWSSPRAPARRPTRPAIASAARPAPPRNYRRPLYVSAVVTIVRRRFPDGRAALCGRRHARRPQGHRRNLRLPHRRLERRAGRVSKTVSRIAPMLGVRPDKNREPNMAEVLPYVHEKAEH